MNCNILALGKSGTGKSSLLNYMLGKQIYETGIGRPVTKCGIFPRESRIETLNVVFYDSFGIEAGNIETWKGIIKRAMIEHGISQTPSKWFHIILYCIQASGNRIESMDTEIINSFIHEGFHVIVVFTKADQLPKQQLDELTDVILNETAVKEEMVIPVCSCSIQNRRGVFSSTFGKEELQRAVQISWFNTVRIMLPKHCTNLLCGKVDNWRDYMYKQIEIKIQRY